MLIMLLFLPPLLSAAVTLFIEKKLKTIECLTILTSAIELIASLMITNDVLKSGSYSLTSYLTINAFGAILLSLVTIISLMTAWYSMEYLQREIAKKIISFGRHKQYYILFNLFVAAMFLAIAATSPTVMWIAIEATTLSTAFLISFYNRPSAIEAAWKYLIINSVGLLLGFFGTLLFVIPSFNNSGQNLISWQTLMANAANFNPAIIKIAFVFTLIGYGTKIGFVPMHTWRPDTYSKAPTPIVALFSGALLNIAFLAILRFKTITDSVVGPNFSQNLFIFFGIVSIVFAAFLILIQKNYKRLLAYSSIEHAGIIALGFGFGGIGVYGAILHMIYHAMAKTILFLTSGNIFLKYSSTKIANVKGLINTLPLTAPIFFIAVLAATGLPPFGLFITEVSIFSAGIIAHPIITMIALFSLALAFIGFLKHTAAMVFGQNQVALIKRSEKMGTIWPLLVLFVILTVFSFYIPLALKTLITSATVII